MVLNISVLLHEVFDFPSNPSPHRQVHQWTRIVYPDLGGQLPYAEMITCSDEQGPRLGNKQGSWPWHSSLTTIVEKKAIANPIDPLNSSSACRPLFISAPCYYPQSWPQQKPPPPKPRPKTNTASSSPPITSAATCP